MSSHQTFHQQKKSEGHRIGHVGWLRAAVLGANDGIVSTASLLIGVAAAGATRESILLAGLAGLVAGAMSMAAGEYVSVYSQADTERADLDREKLELEVDPEGELMELAGIYVRRGVEPRLARQVAEQMTAHDALEAHARDELGITETLSARPLQAAGFSAVSFACGAALPLVVAFAAHGAWLIPVLAAASLAFLAMLGAAAARAGGASMRSGSLRVLFWGAVAMAATAIVGKLFGTAVG
ncbi:MAG: VIT family protein [Pyrinomonadaceae bacterium]